MWPSQLKRQTHSKSSSFVAILAVLVCWSTLSVINGNNVVCEFGLIRFTFSGRHYRCTGLMNGLYTRTVPKVAMDTVDLDMPDSNRTWVHYHSITLNVSLFVYGYLPLLIVFVCCPCLFAVLTRRNGPTPIHLSNHKILHRRRKVWSLPDIHPHEKHISLMISP